MALAAREREKEREHPTASSVLLRPATRGVARSWSPHETNPTSGGRDGMEIPSPALASKPPTTTQGGIAPCAVRRQSVDDRQDNRELVRGIAKNYRDGEESRVRQYNTECAVLCIIRIILYYVLIRFVLFAGIIRRSYVEYTYIVCMYCKKTQRHMCKRTFR